MSHSELTARRTETGAEAAKGWESFLCEQRIESNCRILFTMTSSLKSSPSEGASGGSAQKREKLSSCGGHPRCFGDRCFFGSAVHFFLAGLPNVNRTLKPGA